tara:strand:+ start:70 stop:171 length:102 start_codon:yes stop_codon:yes gene_type:complete
MQERAVISGEEGVEESALGEKWKVNGREKSGCE